jgi:hypothetical protein
MPSLPQLRIPVVAGLAYVEAVRRLPTRFVVTLKPEPHNRFNSCAVAVFVGNEKVGYLPPEISPHYFDAPGSRDSSACPGCLAPESASENTGVLILLDAAQCPSAPEK